VSARECRVRGGRPEQPESSLPRKVFPCFLVPSAYLVSPGTELPASWSMSLISL
jgi:hypothetical protein